MNRTFLICLLLVILVIALCSCATPTEDKEAITIVTTVFSEYDWTRQILGNATENIELILLCDNGTDLHSYQPTVADIATITTCDLLICTGGTSDAWIGDALAAAPSDIGRVVRLTELLSEDELLTEQSHHQNAEHHHGEAYDEHVWLSLRLAERFCGAICDALCAVMPENSEMYRDNCKNYIAQLKVLDEEFASVVENASVKTLLFADRFPFSYLTNDYGIECYAAFPGCSSETEASFATVAFLAERIDSLELPAVVILENASDALAKTVLLATSTKPSLIVTMNSLQSVSRADIDSGTTYLSVMKQNLSALKTALGKRGYTMPQITVENLSLGYDGIPVVENLSFTVHKGDYLCIVGENGSGKSTLIKTLLHLKAPISGHIKEGDGFFHKHIGYLPQQTSVQRDFPASVYEIVLSGCVSRMGIRPFYTKKEKELAYNNMKRLGIDHLSDRCYRELSGGQQQRVLLARALCAMGDMLLLDEPVAGLDPKVTSELYEIINELNKNDGITIIMVSHDVNAIQFASHVLLVDASHHFFGTVEEYRSSRLGYPLGERKEEHDA